MKKKIIIMAAMAALLVAFKAKDGLRPLGLKFVAPTIFDKANVYGPEAGEIVFDTSDSKFWGYSQTNSWVELSSGPGGTGLPAGTILAYGGVTAPDGYVIADGRSLDKDDYPALFAAIGCNFGGECSTGGDNFRVPDLRGRFLRGVDGTAGLDPDKSARTAMATGGNSGNLIGSVQADQFASHNHGVYVGFNNNVNGSNYIPPMANGNDYGTRGTSYSGGNETRPKNANVNYIIKL